MNKLLGFVLQMIMGFYTNHAYSDRPVEERVKQINWNDFGNKINGYFYVGEVVQYDRSRIPTNPDIQKNIIIFADRLAIVREKWGSPLIVNSWYRPPAINASVGGAPNSQHLLGLAADVRPANGQLERFYNWLDKGLWKDHALGYYPKRGFVQLDMRKGRIRWTVES